MKESCLKEQINHIRQQAAASGRIYCFPWVYKSLKEIGIKSYAVDIQSGKGVIFHKEETLEEQAPEKSFVFGAFNRDQIIAALQRHQRGETSYDEWLQETARAGVFRYIVTMAQDMVIYLDQHNTQAYVEPIRLI